MKIHIELLNSYLPRLKCYTPMRDPQYIDLVNVSYANIRWSDSVLYRHEYYPKCGQQLL